MRWMQEEIERLRSDRRAAADQINHLAAEIERLRAYKTEMEHWASVGERMIEPAAQWGPGGNVMVQSSVMFKIGAWWADRPWRVRETIGE